MDVLLKIFFEDTFLKTITYEFIKTFVCELLRICCVD